MKTSQQPSFDFGPEPERDEYVDADGKGPYGPLKFPPEHPVVVLRWDPVDEMVTSNWLELGLYARFRDWPTALELVLHPNNAHVRVKVRPWTT